jgi:hypothetical protein
MVDEGRAIGCDALSQAGTIPSEVSKATQAGMWFRQHDGARANRTETG